MSGGFVKRMAAGSFARAQQFCAHIPDSRKFIQQENSMNQIQIPSLLHGLFALGTVNGPDLQSRSAISFFSA
jgi:hypothetical protein